MKSCIVAFPVYQAPNKLELSFLENGVKLTKNFKQVVVAPEGLIIDKSFGELEKLEVKRFAKPYFEGIRGYNQLLLSKDFYATFRLFDYLLIHQSDVFLFKDELNFWCEKDYDYIGAPWFRPDLVDLQGFSSFYQKIKLLVKKNKLYAGRHNKVGNGGFTLRKIAAALTVLELANPSVLKKYRQSIGDAYNEDIFWSLEAPQITDFSIPQWKEAMHFAVEFNPAVAYHDYLNGQLPFGCHAPLKHDPLFWKKFIPALQTADI